MFKDRNIGSDGLSDEKIESIQLIPEIFNRIPNVNCIREWTTLATSRAHKPPGSNKDRRSVSVVWKRHLFSWNRTPKWFSENLILAVDRAHLSPHLDFSLACWYPISCSDLLFLKKKKTLSRSQIVVPARYIRESDCRAWAQLSLIYPRNCQTTCQTGGTGDHAS